MRVWRYALVPVGLIGLLALLAFFQPKPCSEPITYTIGTIDPRFGLERQTVMDALQRATAIWDRAEGKTLFRYDENSDLPVNFVYGAVQETRDAKQPLVAEVERDQATEKSLKEQIARQKHAYESDAHAIHSDRALFRTALNEHNARAEYWSSIGAVSPEDQARIRQEVTELSGEQAALNARVRQLNELVPLINADVARYNALIAADKATIAIINRDAGVMHMAGNYVVHNGERSINVFEVGDTTSLVNLLAHELGHALGMYHNGNRHSIMAAAGDDPPFDPKTLVSPKVPSAEDAAALHAICEP